jgi:hypothetical protein
VPHTGVQRCASTDHRSSFDIDEWVESSGSTWNMQASTAPKFAPANTF